MPSYLPEAIVKLIYLFFQIKTLNQLFIVSNNKTCGKLSQKVIYKMSRYSFTLSLDKIEKILPLESVTSMLAQGVSF